MSDISMCLNKQCEKREKCHRFTARTNATRQSYAKFKHDERGECGGFWSNEERSK